jgi:antibiotic biosynthesis monooxygenase (ABM) superfamily enzyme
MPEQCYQCEYDENIKCRRNSSLASDASLGPILTKYSLKDSAINLESVMLLLSTVISVILVDFLFLPVRVRRVFTPL